MSFPKLSVVVASHNASLTIEKTLASLVNQADDSIEIIVADNSTDGTPGIIKTKFPQVRLVNLPESFKIPMLWGKGMSLAKGDIVAITTAHCIPEMNWIKAMLSSYRPSYVGVGGAIEYADNLSMVDRAIYFCRYTRYMPPFQEEETDDIPGDNASYRRETLEGCAGLWKDGFWETVVNAELSKQGKTLFSSPSIIVYHAKSFGLGSFCVQRFQHGIHFGSTRAKEFSLPKRAMYIALSPLIPFVFFSHIARRVMGKRRLLKEFISSLPVLSLFILSWSAGELYGYLSSR